VPTVNGISVKPIAQRLLIWLLLMALWEGAYRLVGWKAWLFPAPSHILDAFGAMLSGRTRFILLRALLVSGTRIGAGFALSIALGVALGLAMWRSKFLDDLIGPLFLGLQTLPSVCWVPLAVLTFGLSEVGILVVLVLGSFFAVAIAVRDGLRTVPPIYRKAGQMLGARGYTLYRYVILPAAVPALVSGLRQGFSFAWRSLMGAELILMVEARGLGFVLHQGREFADVAQVVAVMIVMVVIGMVADRWGFARLERRVHARFGLIHEH
jgi:NitT/TauT family transport system permease protein